MPEQNVLHVGICFLEMILAAIWMQNIRVLNVRFVHGMGFYQNFQNISVATLLADTLVRKLMADALLHNRPLEDTLAVPKKHHACWTERSVTDVGMPR